MFAESAKATNVIRSGVGVRAAAKERAGRPRLLMLSQATRADLEEPLVNFRRFEVWHLYSQRLNDIPAKRLGAQTFRFKGPLDLLSKATKIRPAVIQGSEPYHFPWGTLMCAMTMLLAEILRVPYYFPMFENIPVEAKLRRTKGWPTGWFLVPVVRRLAVRYAKGARLIFPLNKGAEDSLLRLGTAPSKVVRHLYGTWGVDIGRFTPKRDGSEPDLGENAILFVGRITAGKGIDILLEAFCTVKRTIPTARLIFIGDGPMVPGVRTFASSHGIAGDVTLLGTVDNRELPPYFRAVKVVATPSISTPHWTEQVGMVNIQSIACGTPVVTTDSGSIPEFIADGVTGLIVPERNAPALQQAIVRLLTDPALRAELSRNGRLSAVQRYDARRNIAEVESLVVDRVLGLRGPGPSAELPGRRVRRQTRGRGDGVTPAQHEHGRNA